MPVARPRIALIGPILPFRGGIAQHTTMLRRALEELADVVAYSFSRQYPSLLFPGDSDRDPAFEGHVEPGTSYSIDTVNPLTWRRAVREIVRQSPDAVVIPWWHVYFAPCFGYMARRLKRAGIPVVFMCHNVVEHESALWRHELTRRVLRLGDGHVVQTAIDEANLRDLLPGASPIRYTHPVYDQFPAASGELMPEHALELLFFGFVRQYKGLDILIEAMGLVPRDIDVRLTVAGEFWGDGAEGTSERIEQLGIGDRVELVSKYLTEAEVAEYFARAHAAVLPYRSATGSGVVAVAYHYDKPVVVTRVGGLPDVVVDGETGYVVEPESPEDLARAIERLASADLGAMAANVDRHKRENMSWRGLSLAVLEAAHAELAAAEPGAPASRGEEAADA